MKKQAYTSAFASIYDDIMGAVPYSLWYDYLQELLDYYQKKPESVLDLACGTGNMSLLFERDGYQVTGIDRSADMLKTAFRKTNKVKYICSDLTEFTTGKKFDLAYCVFDSINYILNLEELKKVFKNVYNSLKDNGIFIFDMNTVSRIMDIEPGSTMINGDGYSCIWEDIVDRDNILWQVRLKIYLEDDERIYEELHQETSYPTEKVKLSLNEAGFNYVSIYNAYTFNNGDDDDNRIYYVIFKSKKHVKKKTVFSKLIKTIKIYYKTGLLGSE
ncbi:MAG: class I SAM-dependent DNA methyltransferase [Halothermotrichaceae bacterium]